jgi:hypothetical protein
MSDAIIFTLKKEAGYFDASELADYELSRVPEETICLSLENSMVTDEGIGRLPNLSKLRCIDLDSTQITDRSMDVISTFKTLEEIWIEDTKVSDAGFKKLALLPNLKYVSFWDTEISDEAFDYVMGRLPDLKSEG